MTATKRRLLKEYRLARDTFIASLQCRGACCPVLGSPVSVTEVHHIRGRLGMLLMDVRGWLAVSAAGHRWIHDNPASARCLGFLSEPGLWGVPFGMEKNHQKTVDSSIT